MSETSTRDVFADQPVEVVVRDGVRFTLLGTAHVSKTSADVVRAALNDHPYDAVAIELCDSRYAAMANPDAWKKLDLFEVVKSGRGGLVAANLALGAYQQRLAEQFGIEPGAEMRAALEVADEKEIPHVLIDRDVATTFKRVFRRVKWWEKFNLFSGLVFGLFSSEEITEEEIEQLKEGDMLESTFAEFATKSERLYDTLIAERDEYMAARLIESATADGHTDVLAVVGAGHLKGLTNHLKEPMPNPSARVSDLSTLPPKGKILAALPWIITLAVLTGFGIGFARSPELGFDLVLTWVLVNGTLAAVGSAIAGGHPLTILSGFFAAPLTSLNPAVAAGMVTASVEAWLRKPTVGDFESLRSDVTQWRGWWRNRVSRVLLVLVLANIGSMLGTWIAGAAIVERLL